ncbi:ABC transporter permease [Vreelandella aquamarina]|uniref:ABC transporter permease n=1 Tax=Halomonas sp. Cn5-12 TaxID=2908885 RepID=UPI001F201508|nr:ABC transporter permease [Halomonas sp. Cn5-12]MCF2914159.1 ABC transporter permease [Halomonas sp. Cn5-12]
MNNSHSAPKGARTPWQVTRSVWYAMFMREAISRTMADRMGWFWMVFEPVALIAIMALIRSFVSGDQLIANAPFIPWMITGMLGFFLVRDGMLRGMGAIQGNSSLFAYRQVQPVDPVLVRNFLEGVLRTFVFLLFILGGLMLEVDLYPDNAVRAMGGWLSLWFLGLGLGLLSSVSATLIPEVGKVIAMVSLPLLIISGVIFPINQMPHWLLEYLMLNPIPHGLEVLRLGFFENYKVIHGTSMVYFWLVTLSLNALGLLMHLRFVDRLKAK